MIFICSTTSGAKELQNRRYVSSFIPLFSIKTQQKLCNDACHLKHSKSSAMMLVIAKVGSWKDLEVASEKEMVVWDGAIWRRYKSGL